MLKEVGLLAPSYSSGDQKNEARTIPIQSP